MHLEEFDKKLKEFDIVKNGRPFVCNGSPLECNIFLVGHNSATEGLFWEFWEPQNGGFDKCSWYKKFKKEKDLKRKTTRKRIEIFFDEFKSNSKIRLLQTNLYCYPSSIKTDIPDEHKRSNVFNFLLKTIKPKAIIAHGKEISTYLCNLNGDGFKKDKLFSAEILNFNTEIYCRNHLAIPGDTNDDCKNLARELRNDFLEKFS